MLWRQVDNYHLVSDCGRYKVSRAKGPEGRWIYQGWGPRHPGNWVNLLCTTADRKAAQAACEAHARATSKKSA